MFPIYVKTGKFGEFNNCLIDKKRSIRNFFFETHPIAIMMDALITGVGSFFAILFFPLMGYAIAAILLIIVIRKFAIYSRNKFVKKQEFHEKLKGE
jgi:hypothetical protein